MSATPSISPALMSVYLEGPVGSPPPNAVIDYKPNEDMIAYGGWLTFGILTGITTIFILLRFYTKFYIQRRILLEDYLLLLGHLLFGAYQCPAIMGLYNGVAQDIWNVKLKTWLHEAYLINICAVIYAFSCWLVKLSILVQYLTIFVPERHLNRGIFWATWGAIGFLSAFSMIFICATLAACVPREKIWNPFIDGKCLDYIAMMEASGAINIFVDFIMLVIPIRATWKLHMDTKRKVSVCVVFLAGILANASSLVRSYYTIRLSKSVNPSQEIFFVGLWSLIELAIGILISCSFVFPQLIRTTLARARSRSDSRGGDGRSTSLNRMPSDSHRRPSRAGGRDDPSMPALTRFYSEDMYGSRYSVKSFETEQRPQSADPKSLAAMTAIAASPPLVMPLRPMVVTAPVRTPRSLQPSMVFFSPRSLLGPSWSEKPLPDLPSEAEVESTPAVSALSVRQGGHDEESLPDSREEVVSVDWTDTPPPKHYRRPSVGDDWA